SDPESTTAEVHEISQQITQLRARLEARAERDQWWLIIDDIYEREVPALQDRVLTMIERDENFSAESLGRLRHWLDELHQHAVAGRRYEEDLEPWQRLLATPPIACREEGGLVAENFRALAEIFCRPLTLSSL